MILVTAANGNQGELLVPKLLAADQLVRACVRSQASAEHLRGLGVHEVVVGDVSEPAVLARAIRGVQKVYHIGPTIHPRERDMGLAVVDAARAGGVQHLVFSSVLHAITTITRGTVRTSPASNDHPTTAGKSARRWTCRFSGGRCSAA